jgi:hypothetical protein
MTPKQHMTDGDDRNLRPGRDLADRLQNSVMLMPRDIIYDVHIGDRAEFDFHPRDVGYPGRPSLSQSLAARADPGTSNIPGEVSSCSRTRLMA